MKILIVICVAVASAIQAQDTLLWFNDTYTPTPFVGPVGGDPLPSSMDDPLQGALIQLIRANGAIDVPTISSLLAGGDGLPPGGNDTVVATTWLGAGLGDGEPYFYDQATLADLGLTLSDSVYIRVYAMPTSGGGNVPLPNDFGFGPTWIYVDSAVRTINTLPNLGNFYDFQFDVTDSSSWRYPQWASPARIVLLGSGATSIANGDNTPTTADGTDFGMLPYGGTNPVIHAFTIANTGGESLTIPSATVSGPAAGDFTVLNVPAVVSPGMSSNFTVRFHPQGVGTRSAVLSLANNDTVSGNLFTFAIGGESINPGTYLSITRGPNGPVISWPGITNLAYQLQRSDMTLTNWANVGGVISNPPSVVSITETSAVITSAAYRLL